MPAPTTTTPITLIDFCNQYQIPYFYLTINYITTADGKMKKQISRLPKGYMEMTYTQAMELPKPIAATHINIILKNSPNKKLIVIDTDSPDAHQTIIANPEINTTAQTTNPDRPGHSHFYYEIDELPAKKIIKTSDNKDMDLIIDNIFEKIEATFDDKQLLTTRLDTIMKIFKPSNQPIALSDGIINIHPHEVIDNNQDPDEPIVPKPQNPVSIELIERMVNGLNPKEFEPYKMWIQLAYCLYNLAEQNPENKPNYYKILNNFLKRCCNYNEAENLNFFWQIKPAQDEARKIKIASLHYWLKNKTPYYMMNYSQLMTQSLEILTQCISKPNIRIIIKAENNILNKSISN